MKKYSSFIVILFILNIVTQVSFGQSDCRVLTPVNFIDRCSLYELEITKIGEFGLVRKERKGVPSHLHTGLDIKRPFSNYFDEPIFPICEGIVISVRSDGPYAQVIVEHKFSETEYFWSVYEHLSGISVKIDEKVNPMKQIGRFMNKEELDAYGWHFDHVHLEIMKVLPKFSTPSNENPQCFFKTYWLDCFTIEDLNKYYYNPREFLKDRMRKG